MGTEKLFDRIVEACPSFAAHVQEHIADNGEILPHVLMEDVGRLIGGLFTGSTNLVVGPPTEGEARAVLAVLDDAMASRDDTVENVVAVSFIEHLWLEPYWDRLKPFLGPSLMAEANRQQKWRAG